MATFTSKDDPGYGCGRIDNEEEAMATIDHRLERIDANRLEADVRLAHVGKASHSVCRPDL